MACKNVTNGENVEKIACKNVEKVFKKMLDLPEVFSAPLNRLVLDF